MPARVIGPGPWGAAIRYWLPKKDMSQADLVRGTGLKKNTISRATRGLPVNTTTLTKIAEVFNEPIEAVLVSPEWMDRTEARRRLIQDAVERALRNTETDALDAPLQPLPPALAQKVKELSQLTKEADDAKRQGMSRTRTRTRFRRKK